MIKVNRKIMTKNDCYKTGRKTEKKGVMVHLTAVSGVMAKDWFSRWNKPGISKCVHYFIDDKEIWQYLDDDYRAWHGGTNVANNDYISIEGCEPAGHRYSGSKAIGYDVKKNQKYFDDMWNIYTNHVANLCKGYGWTEKDVIGHNEAGQKGIASKSSDPHNLFLLHGKNMDDFRADVKKILDGDSKPPTSTPDKPPANDKTGYQGNSIVSYLNSIKVNSSFKNREKLASKNGISNYKGTAEQNLRLLAIMRDGAKSDSDVIKRTTKELAQEVIAGKSNPTSKTLKVGDKVRIKSSAKKYSTGQNIPTSIKNKTYTIMQIKSDRVLLREIYSWVYKKDVN